MNLNQVVVRARSAVVPVRIAIACLLFLFTCLYRFNTLGGAFGGFDNDHFVPFAYAKQVEAGAQPLRDFAGLGLQGAWPSLTYEASALAQRWLGDTLRSEALLTIGGVAAAVAVTFVAAALLSNTFWALLATVLSLAVPPTLYNYPKVLLFACGVLAIVLYARRPGIATVAGAALLTAAAFLFRHDYAVYLGVGMLAVCLVARHAAARRHAVIYAGLTLLLLVPSLLYVQYYAGLFNYLRDGLELSGREADRTNLAAWPVFNFQPLPGRGLTLGRFFGFEPNGVAWLYGLARLLPLAALIALKPDGEPGRPAVRAATLALAVMFAFSAPFLIRGNVAARLGDVGPMLAALLAAVCHTCARRAASGWRVWQAPAILAVLAVMTGTALSARTVGYVESQAQVAGFLESWALTRQRTLEVWERLGSMPGNIDAADINGGLELARYLNQCTEPSDRVALLTYQPQLLPFAQRLFAAGRLSVIPGYVLGPRQQQALVAQWARETVPIALVEYDEFVNPVSQAAPIVRDYLLEHYRRDAIVPIGDGRPLYVFVRRDRPVISTSSVRALPCLR